MKHLTGHCDGDVRDHNNKTCQKEERHLFLVQSLFLFELHRERQTSNKNLENTTFNRTNLGRRATGMNIANARPQLSSVLAGVLNTPTTPSYYNMNTFTLSAACDLHKQLRSTQQLRGKGKLLILLEGTVA